MFLIWLLLLRVFIGFVAIYMIHRSRRPAPKEPHE